MENCFGYVYNTYKVQTDYLALYPNLESPFRLAGVNNFSL